MTEPGGGSGVPGAMRMTRRSAAVCLLVVVGVVASLARCSLLPPGTVPAALDRPLVTYEASGGECPQGECGFRAEIFRDGRVTRTDGMIQTVDPMSLERLSAVVEDADYAAILAVPFEGECPRNYDGQEAIYTFHVATPPVVIASCTTLVDPSGGAIPDGAGDPVRPGRLSAPAEHCADATKSAIRGDRFPPDGVAFAR